MLVRSLAVLSLAAAVCLPTARLALAQEATPPGDPAAVSQEDGKNLDAEGNPTYKIGADGTVDWYTYSGYRRYHAECHVCHGPDGMGSSYAPALAESLKRLNYTDFLTIVSSGRQNVGSGKENVMPAFGTNLNVMCYIDDLYIYLRARAQGDMPRGRPPKHDAKPDAYSQAETQCMGS
jgi:methanol metabolism-related c-type cytochrome